jgi:hypothetical protein
MKVAVCSAQAYDREFLLSANRDLLMSWLQERKTERALDKLRDLSKPRTLVIREGPGKRIAALGATNPCYVSHRTDQLEYRD